MLVFLLSDGMQIIPLFPQWGSVGLSAHDWMLLDAEPGRQILSGRDGGSSGEELLGVAGEVGQEWEGEAQVECCISLCQFLVSSLG